MKSMKSAIPLAAALACLAAHPVHAALDEEEFLSDPPPRNIPITEVEWEELPNHDVGKHGETALAFERDKWKHAETENYIIHYRRVTEAKKVAREIEFNIWFVAGTLQVPKEEYTRKSHAFVFEDEEEWKEFLTKIDAPSWFAAFASGDNLFLDVRSSGDSRRFDSNLLAHEATHAVVNRIYTDVRWPLWLNEGFAEYMAAAGVAARKNQTVGRHFSSLDFATLSLEELEQIDEYPEDRKKVTMLYQSGEKFVRYLMLEFPPERFKQFVAKIIETDSLEQAVMAVYGDQLDSYEEFREGFMEFDVS